MQQILLFFWGGGVGGREYMQRTKFVFGSRFILVGQSLFSFGRQVEIVLTSLFERQPAEQYFSVLFLLLYICLLLAVSV